MKKTIQYTTPTSIEEFQDFCKLNYHVEDEIFKPVLVDGWEDFKISNYGRLYNTKTNKFRKCTMSGKKCDINSILFINTAKINKKYISRSKSICDLMLHAFYPDIFDTHINPIPIDGNIFNLSFGDNIRFIPNAYYKGSDEYREEWIYINGDKTIYTIDTNGVVKNQNRGNELKTSHHKASISHNGIVLTKSVERLMAETFIPNPNKLIYAVLIDPKNTKLSLDNICWTNRHRLVSR